MGNNSIFLILSTIVIVTVVAYLIFDSGGFNPKDISGSLIQGIEKDSIRENILEEKSIDLNEDVQQLLGDEGFQALMKDDDFKELLESQEFKELSDNPAFTELMKNDTFWELIRGDKLKELEEITGSEIAH